MFTHLKQKQFFVLLFLYVIIVRSIIVCVVIECWVTQPVDVIRGYNKRRDNQHVTIYLNFVCYPSMNIFQGLHYVKSSFHPRYIFQ